MRRKTACRACGGLILSVVHGPCPAFTMAAVERDRLLLGGCTLDDTGPVGAAAPGSQLAGTGIRPFTFHLIEEVVKPSWPRGGFPRVQVNV